MIFRFCDEPVEFFKEDLQGFDDGNHYQQFKADGWCTQIIRDTSRSLVKAWNGNPEWGKGRDGSLFFLSRRDMKAGGPTEIPVCPEIITSVEALDLPDKTAIGCEWMARRTVGDCPEMVYLFEILWLMDEWMGEKTYAERFERLHTLLIDRTTAVLQPIPSFQSSFIQNFELIKSDPKWAWTEGVVIKNKEMRIKGSKTKRESNGLMAKIKWRSGASGRDVVK